jgi:hypothetical protein
MPAYWQADLIGSAAATPSNIAASSQRFSLTLSFADQPFLYLPQPNLIAFQDH